MSPALIDEVEEWAEKHGVTRSEGFRRLVEAGLEATSKNGGKK
jgi:hypothetical protein